MRKKKSFELWKQATKDSHKILTMLIEKYDPLRIYQWGSLLDRKKFTSKSDIDIAVEGIESTEAFFSMYKYAEKITNFSLDLIEIEKIEPEFRKIIMSKGRMVYERK